MNGLFNEVMSSAINRSSEFQNLDESVIIISLSTYYLGLGIYGLAQN